MLGKNRLLGIIILWKRDQLVVFFFFLLAVSVRQMWTMLHNQFINSLTHYSITKFLITEEKLLIIFSFIFRKHTKDMMNLRLYIATWTLFCTCAAIPDVSQSKIYQYIHSLENRSNLLLKLTVGVNWYSQSSCWSSPDLITIIAILQMLRVKFPTHIVTI